MSDVQSEYIFDLALGQNGLTRLPLAIETVPTSQGSSLIAMETFSVDNSCLAVA